MSDHDDFEQIPTFEAEAYGNIETRMLGFLSFACPASRNVDGLNTAAIDSTSSTYQYDISKFLKAQWDCSVAGHSERAFTHCSCGDCRGRRIKFCPRLRSLGTIVYYLGLGHKPAVIHPVQKAIKIELKD